MLLVLFNIAFLSLNLLLGRDSSGLLECRSKLDFLTSGLRLKLMGFGGLESGMKKSLSLDLGGGALNGGGMEALIRGGGVWNRFGGRASVVEIKV